MTSRFRAREWPVEEGPTDPFSGIANATVETVTGFIKGITDYPLEAMRAAGLHEPASNNKTNMKDFAFDPNKGFGRMVGTALKAPGDFTYGIAEGFNNTPKIYGDKTVRKTPKITGLGSGLAAAGKVSVASMNLST
jgi:hypothetical protein